MSTFAVMAILITSSISLAQGNKPAARELPIKDLPLAFPPKAGKPTVPTVISNPEDLAKNEVVGMAADALKKQIDFAREKLLVFAWAGSGQDKLSVGIRMVDGKPTLAIQFVTGKTFDLREHLKLYVVPSDVVIGK